jgi:hypothetical protein
MYLIVLVRKALMVSQSFFPSYIKKVRTIEIKTVRGPSRTRYVTTTRTSYLIMQTKAYG